MSAQDDGQVGLDVVAFLSQGAAWDSAMSNKLIDSLTVRAEAGDRLRDAVLDLADTCDSRQLSRQLQAIVVRSSQTRPEEDRWAS